MLRVWILGIAVWGSEFRVWGSGRGFRAYITSGLPNHAGLFEDS